MNNRRSDIFDWLKQGKLKPEHLAAALQLAEVTPKRADWLKFFDRLMLWLGVIFSALSVIFFLAYNWHEMGRFAKFGLVELLIISCLICCWRLNLSSAAGKSTLFGASVLVGALLALVGQTYQTGADTYELFLVWAIAISPWTYLSRNSSQWLFLIALFNVAASLYFYTFNSSFFGYYATNDVYWVMFLINSMALVIWEMAASHDVSGLKKRWPARILAVASGSLITTLVVFGLFDHADSWALIFYAVWIVSAYIIYRHKRRDVFVLAGGVLSLIVVISLFLGESMLRFADAGGFLLIGLIVIGLSAAGGKWLKSVANEVDQ
jgi:uncharacterized membrane protein